MIARLLAAPLRLFAPLKRVGYRLLLAAGVAVMVLFVALGLSVNVQSLAVFVTAIGAALGTFILSLAVPKLMAEAGSQREVQLQAALASALAERSALAQDIERLRSQQLQFQQVQSVLKLTLLEVDAHLTDFKQEALGDIENLLGASETHHYVGVLRKQVKVLLGIDLSQLRVRMLDAQTLLVDGLKAEYQGVREQRDDWLLRQVQIDQTNLVMSNKTVVQRDDARLLEATERHRQDLNERLRTGTELRHFDTVLERLGEQWLRAMLAPMGLRLKLGDLGADPGMAFPDYLNQRLQALGEAQANLERQAAQIGVGNWPELGASTEPDNALNSPSQRGANG